MINQEDILANIQLENWKPILDFLYDKREDIVSKIPSYL